MIYSRVCKHCGDIYKTEQKFSEVCEECKDDNHKNKIMNNLFNGKLN